MFKIKNINNSPPYNKFEKYYQLAIKNKQAAIDAMVISSFNNKDNEVESRFVNLKYIINDKWVFFSNYNSKKAQNFCSHNQISALIYWNSIDLQIRMKAHIKKSDSFFSDQHFKKRSNKKNALAISSDQSAPILSFNQVIEKYNNVKKDRDLEKCPQHWGGFSFSPYEIEFWEGNSSRLNKRNFYKLIDNIWHHSILEP